MIHEVNLLKVCLQRFNVFYSISMVSPVTPKGYIFPHGFPFFSLYPVTAAVKVPMHDSDLHHAGKEEIARLPTVRQGIFWEMSTSSKGKKREKTRVTLGRIDGSLQLPLVRNLKGNKITPLYIMSKNGGNCSVNLKKNTKNFSERPDCRICPSRNHPYHLV